MDDFIRQSSDERRVFFEQTAARMRLSPQIIEKDFWVCWTLKELFRLPEVGSTLIFKGGTSLSKVYRMIERFSEDIDVSLDRARRNTTSRMPANTPRNTSAWGTTTMKVNASPANGLVGRGTAWVVRESPRR
jgi:hypothetical protein